MRSLIGKLPLGGTSIRQLIFSSFNDVGKSKKFAGNLSGVHKIERPFSEMEFWKYFAESFYITLPQRPFTIVSLQRFLEGNVEA
jgi:hypothetical protein